MCKKIMNHPIVLSTLTLTFAKSGKKKAHFDYF